MGLIENYNFEGLCQERYCAEKYCYSEWLEMFGLDFQVLLCEKHWNAFIDKYVGLN